MSELVVRGMPTQREVKNVLIQALRLVEKNPESTGVEKRILLDQSTTLEIRIHIGKAQRTN